MASRTELVCMCEGEKGASIDSVLINRLIRSLKPTWIRKQGSNFVVILPKGGRKSLIAAVPAELRRCLNQGASTTLMVWADLDDDMDTPSGCWMIVTWSPGSGGEPSSSANVPQLESASLLSATSTTA